MTNKLCISVPSRDIDIDRSAMSPESLDLICEEAEADRGNKVLYTQRHVWRRQDSVLHEGADSSDDADEKFWRVTLEKTGNTLDLPFDPSYEKKPLGGNAHNWLRNEQTWRKIMREIDPDSGIADLPALDTGLMRTAFWIPDGLDSREGRKDICLGEDFPIDELRKFLKKEQSEEGNSLDLDGKYIITDAFVPGDDENPGPYPRTAQVMIAPTSKAKKQFVNAMKDRDHTFACVNSHELQWLGINIDGIDLTNDLQLIGLIDSIIKKTSYPHTEPVLILGLELGDYSIAVHSYNRIRIVSYTLLDTELSKKKAREIITINGDSKNGRGDGKNAGKSCADSIYEVSLDYKVDPIRIYDGASVRMSDASMDRVIRSCGASVNLGDINSTLMHYCSLPNLNRFENREGLKELLRWSLGQEALRRVRSFCYNPESS